MIIQEVLNDLKTATHPVAKALHIGTHFKVLVMGFNKGMVLKDHKAHQTTKLTVLEGQVIYREPNKEVVLAKFHEHEIPVEVVHSVEATTDSLCLLTQGNNE